MPNMITVESLILETNANIMVNDWINSTGMLCSATNVFRGLSLFKGRDKLLTGGKIRHP